VKGNRFSGDTNYDLLPLFDLAVELASSDQPEDLAKTILAKHRGGVVLVAGHSDTIPRLAKALGVEWTDGHKLQYDDLHVATIPESGTARLVTLKYGEPALPEK
jgi:hypothetical protein